MKNLKYSNYWYIKAYLKNRIKHITHSRDTKEVQEEIVLRMIREWNLPSNEAEKVRLFLADPDCMN